MDERLAAKIRNQIYFWFLVFLATMSFVWLFSDILLPFIAGMAVAYFLDPVADRLEKMGASRALATSVILIMFILGLVLFAMLIVPLLGSQIATFLENLPELVGQLQALISSIDAPWLRSLIDTNSENANENLSALLKEAAGWVSTLLQQIWASGKSLLSIASLLVVTPVVAFYLLYDWDHLVDRVDGWLPLDHRDTIREIFAQIDDAVAGFVRGQGVVCLILALFYAASLTIVGLNFGLLIGLFIGVTSFIPFVGAIAGFILSMGVALVQFWPDWVMILLVAMVFAVGQFLEGNILQPKLVGGQVGLHPVWLMFALFAFGSLFGFTGMLIAVPAAAAVGVLARFFVSRYLESELYRGHHHDPGDKNIG